MIHNVKPLFFKKSFKTKKFFDIVSESVVLCFLSVFYWWGMSKDFELREDVINQIMHSIINGEFKDNLPSQSALATLYGVSRTTIRHATDYLIKLNIIIKHNNIFNINRVPSDSEKIASVRIKKYHKNQLHKFESFFQTVIKQKIIKPGDEFSELNLAYDSGVDVLTVREYLIQFSRFNLIKNTSKGRWKLIEFTPHYADKLFELREMLECHALNCFMNLPTSDVRWLEMKVLLQEHRELRDNIVERYRDFSELDRKLHTLILSAANNPFINDFIELISVIFHFHYQWDNKNLHTRNILAVEEHLALIVKIVSRDDLGAITELKKHLQTARRSLMNSIS